MRTKSPLGIGLLLALVMGLLPVHARALVPELGVPESARVAGALDGDQPSVEAKLLVHPEDAGLDRVRVAVLLDVAPGWHVGAREPGDLGLPTEISWSAPGATVTDLPWPQPVRFEELGGELWGWGYGGRVLLPAVLHYKKGDAGLAAERTLRAEVELLACAAECIPAELVLERPLATTPAEGSHRAEITALFAAALPAEATARPTSVWKALVLGLIGGLILNLMPCVLPVLAIKAFSLAEVARHGPRQALPHAVAYATGVLGSMLLLALLVVGLRSAGTAVGWGFQFQEPRYIAAISAVLVLFAVNFFGAFEFGGAPMRLASLGASAVGARRSFFDGLLTVALATPCSAPFLGTAAGFAFASPAPATIAVFLSIGVGLAAPLTLVALVPGSASRLPKAGPWMAELRAALGFVLLGAVVWLNWVAARSLDAAAMATLWVFLLAVGFLSWLYGRLQNRGRTPRPLLASAVAGTVLALGLGALRVQVETPGAPAGPGVWSREAVAEELRAGRAAFVVFTADWCITCKVNERLVLANERVKSELDRLDVAVFEADWTLRDEHIRAELARHGRSGVPLYLVFSPDEPERPMLLPEVLSVGRVVDALREAAASSTASALEEASATDEVTAVTRPEAEPSIQDGA
ncbi:MAG: thioredoxin family protein [Myxococcota bacterium]|nr:thioredoxin family protein [Myxococcota bacterium]